MITVEVKIPEVLRGGSLDQIGRATAFRAINRTVDGMVTDISRELRAKFKVIKKEIDNRMKKNYARDVNSLSGSVVVAAKDEGRSNLPLILFGATMRGTAQGVNYKLRQVKGSMQSQHMKNSGKSGVSFKVLQSGGKGFRGDAQIIKGGGSSWQVVRFVKGAKGKERIKELRVLAITEMIKGRQGILDRIRVAADDRMKTNAESAAAYFAANPDKARSGSSKGGRS